jgi:hypothetical protein
MYQQLQNSRLGLGEQLGEEPPAKKAENREGMSHGSHMIIGKAHCLKMKDLTALRLVNFRNFFLYIFLAG